MINFINENREISDVICYSLQVLVHFNVFRLTSQRYPDVASQRSIPVIERYILTVKAKISYT
jgi:hypothetical protein